MPRSARHPTKNRPSFEREALHMTITLDHDHNTELPLASYPMGINAFSYHLLYSRTVSTDPPILRYGCSHLTAVATLFRTFLVPRLARH